MIYCGMCNDTGLQNGQKCPQLGCRKANGLFPFDGRLNIYHLTYGEALDPETDEVVSALGGSYDVLALSDLEVIQAFTRATQGLDLAYRIYMVVPLSLASFEEDLRESRS